MDNSNFIKKKPDFSKFLKRNFLIKKFNIQSEDNIAKEKKIQLLSNNNNKNNNIEYSFFEELKTNEYIISKIKKRIQLLRNEKGFCCHNKNGNIFNQRNIECLELNLYFLSKVINLFFVPRIKFSENKKTSFAKSKLTKEENNSRVKDIFMLQKMQLIELYYTTILKYSILREKFGEFFYNTIDEENRFINSLRKFFFLNDIIEKASKMGLLYLRTLKFYLSKILKNLDNELSEKMNVVKLGFYITKLNFFCYISADFLIIKENNLFEKPSSDKRWKDIKDNLQIELIGGIYRAKIARYIANFSTTFINTVYYFTNFDKFKYNPYNLAKLAFGAIIFFFFSKIRKFFRLYNTIHPKLDMTKLIFGTPEIGVINLYYNFVRARGSIEKDFSIIDFGTYFMFIPKWINNMQQIKQSHKLKFLANFKQEFDQEYFNKSKNVLKNTRLIERFFRINYKKADFETLKKNFLEMFTLQNIKRRYIKKNMIFCLHGGGFISQNTESHLGYYSHIIKDTETFIVSYDYKLAPDNKLENIIEESIKAFEFLYFYSKNILGIEIENYILMGDSAGGLLSMNLLNYIIRKKYTKPKAMILIYPCCRVIFDEMYPSNLFTLTDLMIDTPFISQLMSITMNIEDYYQGKLKIDERYDIFLTDSQIVKQYPQCLIVFGSTDPIRDESYKLGDFLLQHDVKTELKEFLFFNHGFMNISSFIDPYYLPAVDCIKKKISDVFGSN